MPKEENFCKKYQKPQRFKLIIKFVIAVTFFKILVNYKNFFIQTKKPVEYIFLSSFQALLFNLKKKLAKIWFN